MLTLRQRIFIIIGLIAGLLSAVLIYYFLILRRAPSEEQVPREEPAEGMAEEESAALKSGSTLDLLIPVSTEDAGERYARQVARIFVERFGSYSNQNNNRHIDDVMELSTPSMQKWLKTKEAGTGSPYYGVTTLVVASRIESITDTVASVRVDVQQKIEEGGGERVEQRSGKVELLGSGVGWKVNGLYWD